MSLELRDIRVRFDSTLAIDDVSVTIATGEVIALVGPSGCGKSTLLRVIAGLQPTERGSVILDGKDVTGAPAHTRDIGLMFQDHALFAHRSVARNVDFGLRVRKVPAADRQARVSELLALVGLPDFADRSIDGLSGGEAQRVALARALAPTPRVLLLDEPLAALDRSRREQLTDELRRLLRTLQQTTIYVTHDQDEAFAIADRIVVMNQGRIEQVGAPADIWAQPESEFVAEFFGHTVVTIDGKRCAVRSDALSLGPSDVSGQALSSQLPAPETVTMRVTDVVFRGAHHEVRVVDDAGNAHRLSTSAVPVVGTEVDVTIDPTGVAPLSR